MILQTPSNSLLQAGIIHSSSRKILAEHEADCNLSKPERFTSSRIPAALPFSGHLSGIIERIALVHPRIQAPAWGKSLWDDLIIVESKLDTDCKTVAKTKVLSGMGRGKYAESALLHFTALGCGRDTP